MDLKHFTRYKSWTKYRNREHYFFISSIKIVWNMIIRYVILSRVMV